jgi:hypothetical protein
MNFSVHISRIFALFPLAFLAFYIGVINSLEEIDKFEYVFLAIILLAISYVELKIFRECIKIKGDEILVTKFFKTNRYSLSQVSRLEISPSSGSQKESYAVYFIDSNKFEFEPFYTNSEKLIEYLKNNGIETQGDNSPLE